MLVCYYSHMVLGNHSRQWHMEYIGTPVPSIFPHTIVMRMLVSYKSALTSKLWSCDDRKGYSPEDHCFSSTSQCPIPISHYTYNFTHACTLTTCTHAHSHTAPTCTHAHSHTTPTCTHAHMHTHTPHPHATCTHAHIPTCTYTPHPLHTCTPSHPHPHAHMHTCTPTPTCTHAHMHTLTPTLTGASQLQSHKAVMLNRTSPNPINCTRTSGSDWVL